MFKTEFVPLPQAAVEHMSPVAQTLLSLPKLDHLPEAAVEHMSVRAKTNLSSPVTEFLPPLPPLPPFTSGLTAFGDGATINYFYGFAKPPVGLSFNQDLTIGPGPESYFPAPGAVSNVGTIDIGGESLTIHFFQNASFGGLFNSFTLSDPNNVVPDITGVTLVDNGGSAALTQSDITFDANSVTVNLLGTSFLAESEIVLDFSFGSATPAQAGADTLIANPSHPKEQGLSTAATFQGGGSHDLGLFAQYAASFGTNDSGVAPLTFAETITHDAHNLAVSHQQ